MTPITEPRAPLSRERVLHAAIGLADASGIDSLSMRRLAQALGVEAMSLYHHVGSKEEMLTEMVDEVVGEISLPTIEDDWKAGVRRTALSLYEALERHPWATALMLSRNVPARLRYMEAMLGALRRGGFSAEMTDHAYHALDSHIAGFALWEAGLQIEPGRLRDLARGFLAELDTAAQPYLAEHVEQHLRPRAADDPGAFAFGLDLILDGLDRLRSAGG